MSKQMSKFQSEVDLCYKIHDIAMLSCINGVPRYIANPSDSRIAVFTADEFNHLDGDATLRVLRDKHILVYGLGLSGINFDETGLGTLVSSLHKEITIHGVSSIVPVCWILQLIWMLPRCRLFP
jgi:hypothetical protein